MTRQPQMQTSIQIIDQISYRKRTQLIVHICNMKDRIMACTTWKEPSALALATSAGRCSRRCAGRAAPPATACRRARAAGAPSPSSGGKRQRRTSVSLDRQDEVLRSDSARPASKTHRRPSEGADGEQCERARKRMEVWVLYNVEGVGRAKEGWMCASEREREREQDEAWGKGCHITSSARV